MDSMEGIELTSTPAWSTGDDSMEGVQPTSIGLAVTPDNDVEMADAPQDSNTMDWEETTVNVAPGLEPGTVSQPPHP